ncbi:MAG: glycosyltransferase [Desulfovibrionaceae bacterium]|nr:glycosyltransferase [Desulfovibrionaceae bacterium]
MPFVSILMPVYNTPAHYLREAIDSMLAQTFTNFEFLILNDASTDPQVEEVVNSYSDPRIIYAVNEHNLGIAGTRNRLLDMARGNYLALMDHDDISLPQRLEKQVSFLEAHPETGVLNTQFQFIGREKRSNIPLDDISIKMALMMHCGDMCHPSCMLRRSVLVEHGIRYEEMFSPSEDHALFCRLLPHTRFAALPDILFRYRAWPGNVSHRQAKRMEAATQGVLAFARRDNPELWAMAQVHLCRIWRYYLCGIPVLARERTRCETKWRFFGLPVWRVRESLPRWKA